MAEYEITGTKQITELPEATSYTDGMYYAVASQNGGTERIAASVVNGQISELNNALDYEKITLNITAGKYWSATSNTWATSGNFSYSEPIYIDKGVSLSVTVSGYQNEVGILVYCDDTSYTNAKTVVASTTYTKTEYLYTTEKAGYYFISFVTANGYSIKKITKQSTQDLRLNAIEKASLVEQIITSLPDLTHSYFVNAAQNALTSGPAKYWYSDLVELNIGAIVTITSSDPSGAAVGRLSEWDSTGTELIEILETATTTVTTVTHTATKKEYIRFSGFDDNPFNISITNTNIPQGFTNSVKTVIEDMGANTSYMSFSMFDDIGVCGDSYTAGAICDRNGSMGDLRVLGFCPYGNIIERMTGVNVETYAVSGATTVNYQTNENCLPKILNDTAKQLYIFALGINDYSNRGSVPLGTIDDIKEDYTLNPNTFYGNYGKILAQVIAHAPNAKIILSSVFIPTFSNGAYYDFSAAAIAEIAAHFNIMYIDTKEIQYLNSVGYNNIISANGGHPTAPLYSAIALSVKELVEKNIKNNLTYYNSFIPISG